MVARRDAMLRVSYVASLMSRLLCRVSYVASLMSRLLCRVSYATKPRVYTKLRRETSRLYETETRNLASIRN